MVAALAVGLGGGLGAGTAAADEPAELEGECATEPPPGSVGGA